MAMAYFVGCRLSIIKESTKVFRIQFFADSTFGLIIVNDS
jgi:hypothetical protein